MTAHDDDESGGLGGAVFSSSTNNPLPALTPPHAVAQAADSGAANAAQLDSLAHSLHASLQEQLSSNSGDLKEAIQFALDER